MATESTLRDMAKAYAGGKLDKAKYRAARTAYVESVVSGSVTLLSSQDSGDPASTTTSTDLNTRNSPDKTSMMGSEAYSRTHSNEGDSGRFGKAKTGLFIGGAALLVLIVAVGISLSGNKQEPSPAAVTASSAANSASAIPDTAPTATITLIRAFLASNNWSQPTLDKFVADWQQIPDADRSASMSSVELGQLSNAIYKKLLEERALSGIGNPETSLDKQRQLVKFAASIGIQDQKISLPEFQATGTP
jgi:hypothetical protein